MTQTFQAYYKSKEKRSDIFFKIIISRYNQTTGDYTCFVVKTEVKKRVSKNTDLNVNRNAYMFTES